MQLKPEQLEKQLQKSLAPVYFISGDEPLRVMEAADAVRARARQQGFTERDVLTVQPGFDWNSLSSAAGNLSLFSERRIVDVRLPTGRPGDAGAKALRAWAEQPPEDTVLLVTAGKLDAAARKSKWVQALGKAGVVVFVWHLDTNQLPAWIRARMLRHGLQPTESAVTLLAERTEGNLLACVQEIEKLYLLRGAGQVDADDITRTVADSARFDVYALADSALAGEGARSVRILNGLHAEGVAPPVVLWALARDIRQLASMTDSIASGETVSTVLARFRVWANRKPQFARALERLSNSDSHALLRRCAAIDKVIKGQAAGNEWDEMLQLTLQLAGVDASQPADLTESV
ncbi:MAG: DNA polymerase III subunit delta [Gammaproteobacteria bacterium]|nr:MAG: DNA polymerase III subunit delta [Gammaproteobacteria bacterium]